MVVMFSHLPQFKTMWWRTSSAGWERYFLTALRSYVSFPLEMHFLTFHESFESKLVDSFQIWIVKSLKHLGSTPMQRYSTASNRWHLAPFSISLPVIPLQSEPFRQCAQVIPRTSAWSPLHCPERTIPTHHLSWM